MAGVLLRTRPGVAGCVAPPGSPHATPDRHADERADDAFVVLRAAKGLVGSV